MISAEAVLVLGVALFVLALAFRIFLQMLTTSLVLYGTSLILCAWVLLAANVQPSPNDVTYHTVQHQKLNDGTAVDFIVVQNVEGGQRTVNVNETLGIKVPDDGKPYRIARVRYDRSIWGLLFQHNDSYKLVPNH